MDMLNHKEVYLKSLKEGMEGSTYSTTAPTVTSSSSYFVDLNNAYNIGYFAYSIGKTIADVYIGGGIGSGGGGTGGSVPEHNHDERYAKIIHDHDDRYYTKKEEDAWRDRLINGDLLFNKINANHIQAGTIVAGSTIIANGAIGSAQISSLSADKLDAGLIDTARITICGTNSNLMLRGNRLQVFEGLGIQRVERVSLGDVNNDGTVYGLRVRGKDGKTVLYDENGVYNEGITNGSITDEKVAGDANIHGTKLNIKTVIDSINDDNTTTINGLKIEIDGQTISSIVNQIKLKQDEHSETITRQQSEIQQNQDNIKLKVSNQKYQEDMTIMESRLDRTEADITVLNNSIKLTASKTEVQNQITQVKDFVSNEIDDITIGGANYLNNTAPRKAVANTTIPWDKTLNGSHKLSYWQDYNSSVQNPQVGYHPHIDLKTFSFPCIALINKNNTFSMPNRELALKQEITDAIKYLVPDEEYILSFDGYSDVASFSFTGGLYHKVAESGSYGYNSGRMNVVVQKENINTWKRYTFTFRIHKGIRLNDPVYLVINGHNNPEGSSYIKNIKLERGNKPSHWTPSAFDMEDMTNDVASEMRDYINTSIREAKAEIKIETDNITQSVESVEKTVTGVKNNLDNLKIGGRNLVRKNDIGLNNATGSFDATTNTWTLTANSGSGGNWGCGLFIKNKNAITPYGKSYILSFEIKVPRNCSWNSDVNNYALNGSSWSGNDNDNTSKRATSSKDLTANVWTKCWVRYENSNPNNASKVDIYDNTTFGVLMLNETSNMTFYIRNVQGELGTIPTEWTPAPEDVSDEITTKITQAKSEIKIETDKITQSVSRVETDVKNMSFGGRNLLRYSRFDRNDTSNGWGSFSGSTGSGLFGTTYKYSKNTNASTSYSDILQQTIYIPTNNSKYLKPSTWYTFSFYSKGVGKIRTHIYPSLIDTGIKGYCDNVEANLNSDGNRDWNLTNDWVRHVYTFKTKSTIPNANQMLLFRLYGGNEVYICAPQLEEGNKVSDWTPSPDDFSSEVSQKISEAKSEIKITTDSITNTVTKVQEEYGKLSIGGRNHVLNSSFKNLSTNWSNWGTPSVREFLTIKNKNWCHVVGSGNALYQGVSQCHYDKGITAESNQVYTFSALVYGNSANQVFTVGVHFRKDNTIMNQQWKSFTVGTTPQRVTHSFSAVTSEINSFNIMLGVNDSSKSHNVYFTDVKFERGNKPTDWTPAPEDTGSEIDKKVTNAKSEIKQTTDSITSRVERTETSVSGLDKKYTEIKQTVDGIDLTGFVTFSNLSTAGRTTINGANITTGTIDTNRVNIKGSTTKKIVIGNDNYTVYDGAESHVNRKIFMGFRTNTAINVPSVMLGYNGINPTVDGAVTNGGTYTTYSHYPNNNNPEAVNLSYGALAFKYGSATTQFSTLNMYQSGDVDIKAGGTIHFRPNLRNRGNASLYVADNEVMSRVPLKCTSSIYSNGDITTDTNISCGDTLFFAKMKNKMNNSWITIDGQLRCTKLEVSDPSVISYINSSTYFYNGLHGYYSPGSSWNTWNIYSDGVANFSNIFYYYDSNTPVTTSVKSEDIFNTLNSVDVVEAEGKYLLVDNKKTRDIKENKIVNINDDKERAEVNIVESIAVLWKAVQELKQENEELKLKLKEGN